jgi:hypothetical protein
MCKSKRTVRAIMLSVRGRYQVAFFDVPDEGRWRPAEV